MNTHIAKEVEYLSDEYLDYYRDGVLDPAKTVALVGMSGGVDSSVAAVLMQRAGFRVVGVTLQLSKNENKIKSCCSTKDIHDAQAVALNMNFPHYVLDYSAEFKTNVVDNFVDEYSRGYTPSPCVRCNQHIKFGELMRFAKQIKADLIVTGHYIRHKFHNNAIEFHRAEDLTKDQTYFMSMVPREHMDMIRFPLGLFTKPQVRKIAEHCNLEVAKKPDSQDLCFIQNGNYRDILREMIALSNRGPICDLNDNILGYHKGIENYTIGQKRGIEVHNGPWYVLKIDAQSNKIIIGRQGDLARSEFWIDEINWMSSKVPKRLLAKVRARHDMVWCTVRGNLVTLDNPAFAIAPGQICAFYNETKLIGGGRIVADPFGDAPSTMKQS